ncbi:hypothetical protein FNV43_RR02703 [Rhamnella rubrinervis]|uniref:Uncharacterized protein n=1 Tax=Rhamnella rubrinervis TaxID=2594499 RepID=A0A8K0MNW0_9ROSA|nr:hypothetical protein FNV43_RR02703 [Rhamnella rubrinervis]
MWTAYRWIHRVMQELNIEIACFRLGKTNIMAVSSPEIAREFLKKNDAVFASMTPTTTSTPSAMADVIIIPIITRASCQCTDGREDGGPGDEEEEHSYAVFTILLYLYAFSVSDYLPWLRVFDFGGHKRMVNDALEVIKKYQDGIVNERIQQWREGRKMEAEDLLDVFISLKHENGDPLLSSEEIKAQITV